MRYDVIMDGEVYSAVSHGEAEAIVIQKFKTIKTILNRYILCLVGATC